jgi:hypothetical protein
MATLDHIMLNELSSELRVINTPNEFLSIVLLAITFLDNWIVLYPTLHCDRLCVYQQEMRISSHNLLSLLFSRKYWSRVL